MLEAYAIWTWLIIAVTVGVSIAGFRRPPVVEALIFDPWDILAGKQFYRVLTSGFLHADYRHLLLNMVSLYFFGPLVELASGPTRYLVIYLGAIGGGSLLSLYVHRHHEYRAYGASGGVCGIIFAHLLLFPGGGVIVWPLPVSIPAWLYVILFMVGSFHAMKQGHDNVGHDAHLGGAIIGFILAAALNLQPALQNWKILVLVLALSLALLAYLYWNPLLLPLKAFLQTRSGRGPPPAPKPVRRPESKEVDALLEKINRSGMHSLTPEERAFLESVSGKYRRRAESTKPKSDLVI